MRTINLYFLQKRIHVSALMSYFKLATYKGYENQNGKRVKVNEFSFTDEQLKDLNLILQDEESFLHFVKNTYGVLNNEDYSKKSVEEFFKNFGKCQNSLYQPKELFVLPKYDLTDNSEYISSQVVLSSIVRNLQKAENLVNQTVSCFANDIYTNKKLYEYLFAEMMIFTIKITREDQEIEKILKEIPNIKLDNNLIQAIAVSEIHSQDILETSEYYHDCISAIEKSVIIEDILHTMTDFQFLPLSATKGVEENETPIKGAQILIT